MNLQTIFYFLGATYFLLSLILLVILGLAIVYTIWRLKQIRDSLHQKLTTPKAYLNAFSHPKLRRFIPLVALIPVIFKAIESFRDSSQD